MWRRIFIPPVKSLDGESDHRSAAMNSFEAMASYGDNPLVINGTYIHTYIHTVHTYTYIYIYIHTYIHTCKLLTVVLIIHAICIHIYIYIWYAQYAHISKLIFYCMYVLINNLYVIC